MDTQYPAESRESNLPGDDYICLLSDILLQRRRGRDQSQEDIYRGGYRIGGDVIISAHSKLILQYLFDSDIIFYLLPMDDDFESRRTETGPKT